jgi:hypothetical protein
MVTRPSAFTGTPSLGFTLDLFRLSVSMVLCAKTWLRRTANMLARCVCNSDLSATHPKCCPWNRIISRQRPSTPRSSNGDRDATTQRQDQDQEHEPQSATRRSHNNIEDVRQCLRPRSCNNVFERRHRHTNRDNEEQARDASDRNAQADGVRHLDRSVMALLCHTGYHSNGREAVGCGQQTDEEGEIAPARKALVVVSECVARRVSSNARCDRKRDHDDDY